MKTRLLFPVPVFGVLFWIASIIPQAIAQTPETESFTVESLSQLIRQKNISSIEALLPELPGEFLSNAIFVYNSQSTQYADALNPRTILFNANSNVVMAMNSAAAPDSQRLEIIQFDPKRRAFDFYEGNFAGGKPALILPRTDCARCHREDLRPNWQAYFHWAGVYGSDDGTTTGKLSPPDEAANYQRFSAKMSSDPRYKWFSQTSLSVNLDFTELMGNRNFKRVSRILKSTPHFAQFKYAYLGAQICTKVFDTFLPDHLKPTPAVQTWNDFMSRSDGVTQKTPLYYLFELQGIRFGDFSMTFKPSLSEMDQYFTTPGYPEAELAYAFLDDMPELVDYASVNPGIGSYPYASYAMKMDDEHCAALAKMSREALKDIQALVPPTTLAPPTRVMASLSTCLSCHVGSSQLAPLIPFDDEIALKKELSATESNLYAQIVKRIAVDAPKNIRMPPSGTLEQTDRETIRSYVDSLMR